MKPFALSVKMIIRDDMGRCLLLKRSMDSKNNPGKWDFPGGKLDVGEAFDQALIREVTEETGLKVAIDKLVGSAQSESPSNRIIYLLLEGRTESGTVALSDEHDDFLWVYPNELEKADICDQFKPIAKIFASTFNS
ncbi:NUDIX domain-containing protein [bacterium]|nr:NUDIX domain-containing protein [bacterium]